MTGDEIGVEVREEDVANLQAVPFGRIEIPLHVALRIDDDGRPALAVADEVRRVRETIEVELLEDHGRSYRGCGTIRMYGRGAFQPSG